MGGTRSGELHVYFAVSRRRISRFVFRISKRALLASAFHGGMGRSVVEQRVESRCVGIDAPARGAGASLVSVWPIDGAPAHIFRVRLARFFPVPGVEKR